jgi:hypothetical protein
MQMKLLGITKVDFLYLADTREKMGVYWCSASAFYRFQESLRFG